MLHFLAEYSLFLAKIATFVVAVLLILAAITSSRDKGKTKDKVGIKKINKKYALMQDTLQEATLNKTEYKKALKARKKEEKLEQKQTSSKKRLFVLNFIGDIRASAVTALREEVTALLTVATPRDEVVVVLESPGGMVSNYGLAASQLVRIKAHHIPLTVVVDRVAASGGYLMASVADQILAAPFAAIGSIGVVAQVPNFHRLLKKNDVDYELVTAGEFKRTLTLFGENTDKARHKVQEDINEIHALFKHFIEEHRPQVDINSVATGEYWLGSRALTLKLVDGLKTSDDYLLEASKTCELFEVFYKTKKSLMEKFGVAAEKAKLSFMPVRHDTRIY